MWGGGGGDAINSYGSRQIGRVRCIQLAMLSDNISRLLFLFPFVQDLFKVDHFVVQLSSFRVFL